MFQPKKYRNSDYLEIVCPYETKKKTSPIVPLHKKACSTHREEGRGGDGSQGEGRGGIEGSAGWRVGWVAGSADWLGPQQPIVSEKKIVFLRSHWVDFRSWADFRDAQFCFRKRRINKYLITIETKKAKTTITEMIEIIPVTVISFVPVTTQSHEISNNLGESC